MDMSKEHDEFLKKVKRTIYVDNISPKVTETVIKASFNQFGNVIGVQFIPLYMQPRGAPQAALVEMENMNQAEQIISEMKNPFMIGGLPRPVRVKPARVEMFDDRPRKPGKRIQCHWLDPKEPGFETTKRIKKMVKRHAEEALFMLNQQVREEKNLEEQQIGLLNAHNKKHYVIDGVFADGTVKRLAQHYRVNAGDF